MVFDREDVVFQVMVNHEEQYSIWPGYKEICAGWTARRRRCGSRPSCRPSSTAGWTCSAGLCSWCGCSGWARPASRWW